MDVSFPSVSFFLQGIDRVVFQLRLFIENSVVLVFSISPIQRIGQFWPKI
jgi:hypothetical protein